MQFTQDEVTLAIAAVRNKRVITHADVRNILAAVKGTAFASITSVTPVPTAAAYKGMDILKVATMGIQLFNNLSDYTDVYTNAVKRSASKPGMDNDAADVANFQKSDNWFAHSDDCFSLIVHKKDASKHYLYVICNKAESVYTIDGVIASKEEVAQYMTPGEAKKLLNPEATVYNVRNDVMHTVICRTVSMENIIAITAQKQTLTV